MEFIIHDMSVSNLCGALDFWSDLLASLLLVT
jgi:hypothetical protein